ncbi:MAG: hydrogenase formation protein HypD [Desulfurococcaceae archaeon]
MDLAARVKRIYEGYDSSARVVEFINKASKRLSEKGINSINIMDFCGTHEWTIVHYGLRSLMPREVSLVAGPGCPVCITPGLYVDYMVKLSFEGFKILTYGDAYKLPGTTNSKVKNLYQAKALGGEVEVVYSFIDAIRIARENSSKNYVFFSVGFETTMPAVAIPLYSNVVPRNIMVFAAHRYTPPVVKYLLDEVREVNLSGVIAPGHVSTIIGSSAWSFIPRDYRVTAVVAGFEPVDVLVAVLVVLKQLLVDRPALINEYARVVKPEGNTYALRAMNEVFERADSYWRGIGVIKESGAVFKDKYREYDAASQLGLKDSSTIEDIVPGCKCSEIVLGLAKPSDCPLFMTACTPENPIGPCMVGSEGTCRIWAENPPLLIDIDLDRSIMQKQ